MRLHENGQINLLGRCRMEDGRVFDPMDELWPRISGLETTDRELEGLKREVEDLLDEDRLNVFSREGIFGDRLPAAVHGGLGAVVRVRNMRRVLRDVEVKVLITLRSPVDFLFAAYVESYHLGLHRNRRLSTLRRFLDLLIGAGERWRGEVVFFQDDWLRSVARSFGDIEVLLYEDLRHAPRLYFSRLAACLGADPEEVERLFNERPRHVGAWRGGRKLSPSTPVLAILLPWLPRPLRQWADSASEWARRRPGPNRLRGALRKMTVRVPHRLPDPEVRDTLQRLLGLRDDYLMRVHGVSAEKLARYGYLHPDYDPGDEAAGFP